VKKPKWGGKYLGDIKQTASVQSTHQLTLKKDTSHREACVHWIILYRLMVPITMFIMFGLRVFIATAVALLVIVVAQSKTLTCLTRIVDLNSSMFCV
jgi:hypothetical protein